MNDSYAESKRKEYVDWTAKVKAAHDEEDYKELNKLNDDWTTSPIGCLPKKIRRYWNGKPIDAELFKLANKFSTCLNHRDKFSMIFCLELIEERSAFLLDQTEEFFAVEKKTKIFQEDRTEFSHEWPDLNQQAKGYKDYHDPDAGCLKLILFTVISGTILMLLFGFWGFFTVR